MTPANRPPLATGSGRKIQSLHVPARSAAERPGPLRQSADRGRHRRDARGRDRGRRAVGAALRRRAGAGRARRGGKLRAGRASAPAIRPTCSAAMSRPVSPRPRKRIEATYETPPQYHNRWSRMRSSRHGTAIRSRSTRRRQGLAMALGRLAGLFGMSPDKIHIRSPFLGGGFGSKGLISGPQVLGIMAARAGRQAGQAGAAARADVRPGRTPRRRRGRPCGSAPTRTAS